MSKAIIQTDKGGPEVLEWREREDPTPAENEVALRHTAIGVNFIDIYVREGAYPMMTLPGTPGMEAAGVVESLGPGVEGLKVGDRVAYVTTAPGSYSERRVMPADRLVPLPDDISDDTAAALMLKGMTVERLLHKTAVATADDTILVHAAAGGVGLLLTAWAKAIGATVIGTVGSDAKAKLAADAGADHVIVSTKEDVAERVAEITGGKGCRLIYDGVGKDTFETSLKAVSKFGHLISFGNASGAVPPVNIAVLAPKCIALSRPQVFPYIADRADLLETAENLFAAIRKGIVRSDINQTFPLAEAAEAHRALAARRTTGQIVLHP
ncbi:quinone oxidoreductase family protein [Afifella marina]|uniref:NADPH2:quinone reductase n=2 Tax=Hyphomicrobiales TaxID=356 RepID=A0A1G5MEY7_AFIMA|nr:quinone oxidoreductase [Afifella marina]MBK1622616.1 quinone oxidoreductase [Afifella marina DSM 2698]MBK1625611.1 quinone oxidoreductase [Afifella marina]MBK5917434.1 quinone oxidoreductase [Afifella marina]RAI23383.1 quinone oxidoreductase [Afifella marina DSM 2698]SCZ23009.1 NADPH2:quinone reductase [Afifella marina DSM 2698]